MYSLIKYISNCSETRGNLWFYSRHEAIDFNADIANGDNFKSFTYKAKLLENTAVDGAIEFCCNFITKRQSKTIKTS